MNFDKSTLMCVVFFALGACQTAKQSSPLDSKIGRKFVNNFIAKYGTLNSYVGASANGKSFALITRSDNRIDPNPEKPRMTYRVGYNLLRPPLFLSDSEGKEWVDVASLISSNQMQETYLEVINEYCFKVDLGMIKVVFNKQHTAYEPIIVECNFKQEIITIEEIERTASRLKKKQVDFESSVVGEQAYRKMLLNYVAQNGSQKLLKAHTPFMSEDTSNTITLCRVLDEMVARKVELVFGK